MKQARSVRTPRAETPGRVSPFSTENVHRRKWRAELASLSAHTAHRPPENSGSANNRHILRYEGFQPLVLACRPSYLKTLHDRLGCSGLNTRITFYISFSRRAEGGSYGESSKERIQSESVSREGWNRKGDFVAILEPDQFFGEGCLNGQSLRIATATALQESLVTAITKAAMTEVLRSEPKFSEMFVAYLLTRNSRVEEDLIDQLFNSSEKRLARLLLLLANFGKEGSPQPIDAHFDQGTLAEMIGTTRSRVSSFMNKFRKLGFISYNGKVEVHPSLLSAVLHDRPRIENDDTQD
jgi:CRP/FNR family transcriptional regulator, cyclic AMP receptor protein